MTLTLFRRVARKLLGDAHFYNKLDEVEYDGRKYKVPSDIDAYLEIRFPKWRIPDPHYDSSMHDNAALD